MTEHAFTSLPDLASRSLGGAVVVANDEFFAEKENLVKPEQPVFQPHTFGHKGQIYDGWETRRRRDGGHDWAIVRLGAPGVVRGVVVDTAFFTGNFPEYCAIEGASFAGYPSVDELLADDVEWVHLVPKSRLKGDTRNHFVVSAEQRFTHVRLSIYPDGGVARLRVHGDVVPDPQSFAGLPLDLGALENGATVVDCSNMFYAAPNNLLLPGTARVMGEGWETARRRDADNDWVIVRLAGTGLVRQVGIDTTHFKGNAPGWFRLSGGADVAHCDDWADLIPRTRLQPDTPHRFPCQVTDAVRFVRVDVYPDGGFARLRVFGELTSDGRQQLGLEWFNRLPADHAEDCLVAGGLRREAAASLVTARPLLTSGDIDAALLTARAADAAVRRVRALLLGS